MSADPRRDELLGWISSTRKTQRKLTYVVGIMILASSVLLVWDLEVGLILLTITAILGIAGFWITSSHILDWSDRLAGLHHERHARAGRRG